MVKVKEVYEAAEKGIQMTVQNVGKFKKPVAKVPYVKMKKVISVEKITIK